MSKVKTGREDLNPSSAIEGFMKSREAGEWNLTGSRLSGPELAAVYLFSEWVFRHHLVIKKCPEGGGGRGS